MDGACCEFSNRPKIVAIPFFVGKLWPIVSIFCMFSDYALQIVVDIQA